MSRLAVHWSGLSDPSAPTLVLLHGYSDSGPNWADALARWGDTYRIAAPDALGHGESPRFTDDELGTANAEPMYDATVEFLEELAPRQLLVVGHSMGGALAGMVAARRPELLRAAVLEDPAWAIVQQEARTEAEVAESRRQFAAEREDRKAALARRGWPESELEPWARAKEQLDPRLEAAIGRTLSPPPIAETVAGLAVPTLVVTGDHEVILNADRLDDIERVGNVHVRVAVIPNAAHCVRRDQGEAFHAVVDPFLAAAFAG